MQWEFSLLYALQEIHAPWLDSVMTFITTLGNSAIYNIWIIIGVVCLFFKKYRKMGLQLLFSMLLTFLVGNLFLKNAIARVRPCEIDTTVELLISRPGGWSFPSGHSMNSMVAAIAIFLNNKKLGIPAIVLAALIGLSRLYHFVHFPTDVLAGFVIAILAALLMNYIFTLVMKKMQKKTAA